MRPHIPNFMYKFLKPKVLQHVGHWSEILIRKNCVLRIACMIFDVLKEMNFFQTSS